MNRTRLSLIAMLALSFIASSARAETSGWVADYNRLLGKYVTGNGVRYSEWKSNAADLQALDGVVNAISRENVSGLGQKDQLAFYINAYNAWILHEALGKYPTKSVKDALFSFFTSKRIKVAGEQTSFKALEDKTIRGKFADPHVHFALNCASRSCPPLQSEAFRGDKLDAQLEKLARAFVNSDRGVRVGQGSVELSKIFDWYKDDFAKQGGAVEFINKRRTTPLPKDAKISYQDYNWALNDAK
ncbi:MAG: DUF547 domain-containing protein [Chthoniobacterales bacterium]